MAGVCGSKLGWDTLGCEPAPRRDHGGAPVPPPLLAPAARGLSAPRPTERISARIAARDMLPVGGGAPLTNMPPAPAQPPPEPSADGADAALAAIDDAAAAPVAGPPVDV